jgi:hypothetical protein
MGYNAVQSGENQLPFRRKVCPTSSGLKGTPSKEPVCNRQEEELGLLFGPEDGRDKFFRNVGRLSPNYTTLYPRRQNSSLLLSF